MSAAGSTMDDVNGGEGGADNSGEESMNGKGASVTYPIIFLMGIIANSSVLLTILFGRKLTRTIVLIANMSIADLLMLFTGCYLRYYDRFTSIANTWFCKMFNAADIMFLQISSLTILAMAYERLIKVTDRANLTRENEFKAQMVVCGFICLVGLITSAPAAIYGELHSKEIACIATYTQSFQIRYHVYLFVATYCIPGVIIALIYSLIIYKTKSVLSVLSSHTLHQSRIFRMLAALVGLFWLFHFPFWLCMFRAIFGPQGYHCSPFWRESAIVFTYVNATVNPFLYAIITTHNCTLSSLSCEFAEDDITEDQNDNDNNRSSDDDGSGGDNSETVPQRQSVHKRHQSKLNSNVVHGLVKTEEILLNETGASGTTSKNFNKVLDDVGESSYLKFDV